MSDRSIKKRRANLMREHPFCHWCGTEVLYFKTDGGQIPRNFATIDHINSRLMHPDGRPKYGERVLSCPGCNQGRNEAEQKYLGVEELTRRSRVGRHYTSSPSTISSSLREFSIL